MEETKVSSEEVNIDEAINIASGTRKYQKIMVLTLLLGPFSISPIIMCSQFFLPQLSDDWLKNTMIEELFPLAQGLDQVNLFRNFFSAGVIIGCLIFSWLADKYGRKKVIEKSLIIGSVSMAIAALSINFTMICLAGFVIGSMYVAIHLTGFILCMESLDFKDRNYYLGIYQLSWPLSTAFFTALFWVGIYWRYILLVSAGILITEMYLLTYVEESPRFLLTNVGDIKGSRKIMKRIARMNGEAFSYNLKCENTRKNLSLSIRDIFYSKWTLFQIAMCGFMWFTINFYIFGLAFDKSDKEIVFFMESDYDADVYFRTIVNCILVAISILAVYVPVINRFGRKKIASIALVLDGLLFIFISFLLYFQVNDTKFIFISIFIARLVLGGQFTVFYIYTAEQFPTYIRCTCIGLTAFFGKMGGILDLNESVETGNLYLAIMLTITGALSILIAYLIVYLEETHHKVLDEMIENRHREPLLDKN